MGKPGRLGPDLDDYLDWQERLENYKASNLSVEKFCVEEGVSRSTFYRWTRLLRKGIPKAIAAEITDDQQAAPGKAEFLPVSLKSPPVEIELPNGGVIRLPLGVGQVVMMKVLAFVADL